MDHSVRSEPLRSAIAALTGVSSGTAAQVPLLLLGSAPGGGPHTEDGVEAEGARPLHRLTRRRGDYEQTLFVSDDDLALQRYVEHDSISTEGIGMPKLDDLTEEERREIEAAIRTPRRFRIERTVRYQPRFDHEIDASRFDFVPTPAPATR